MGLPDIQPLSPAFLRTRSEVEPTPPSRLLITLPTGKKAEVKADFDVDGTINNGELPEEEREASMGPAIRAVGILKRNNISINLDTGRGVQEASRVYNLIGADGDFACEDGTVGVFNRPSFTDEEKSRIEELGFQATSFEGKPTVIFSRVTSQHLQDCLATFEMQVLGASRPGEKLISSIFTSPEEIMKVIKYADVDAARRGVDRLASHWIVLPPDQKKTLAAQLTEFSAKWIPKDYEGRATEWPGIRTFGEPLHFLGADAHKGIAARWVNEHKNLFHPELESGIDGYFVIAFGDRENDLTKCRELIASGRGEFVLVAHPDETKGFAIADEQIEAVIGTEHMNQIIKTPGAPYGYGILSAIPEVFNRMVLIDSTLKDKLSYPTAQELIYQ